MSLIFSLDFFFEHAAPLMFLLQYLLKSLVLAVILEAFIRRPERKEDLSVEMKANYIAYADYLLHHCSVPSKTDRWALECLMFARTDWLPAASDERGVVVAQQPQCFSSSHQLQLPSYAFFWQHQQQTLEQLEQLPQQQNERPHQQTQHNQQQHQHQHVRKRLKTLPPLHVTAAS
jgi:hypothetical protein